MGIQVVQHNVDFDCVSFEAIVNLSALYQIAQVREAVRVLDGKWSGDAAMGYSNATKRYLAEIAARRRRRGER